MSPATSALSRGYFDSFPLGDSEAAARQHDDQHAYALEIAGDSMEPVFRRGDVIIVSPSAPVRSGDRVVVKTTAGEILVRELARKTARLIELRSPNRKCRPRILSLAHVVWIARIAWSSQ